MEFCPKCSTMLMPDKNQFKCTCGYVKELSGAEKYIWPEFIDDEEKIIIKKEDICIMPTTKITCYKCGHRKGAWWLMQTKRADEPETRFIRCLKCGNTWRQHG